MVRLLGFSHVGGPHLGAAQAALQHALEWGGLPVLLQYPVEERREWLDAYQATYLKITATERLELIGKAPLEGECV